MPANRHILSKIHLSTFQEICSGCCTRPLSATSRARSPERPVKEVRFRVLLTKGGAEQVGLLMLV